MIARRLSSVAARMSSWLAPGLRSATPLATLASTAGHRPSMALIQSGRAAGADGLVQAGLAAARSASAASGRVAKNACQDGSTDEGSLAQRAYRSSTKAALPPYRNEVSASTSLIRPASSAMSFAFLGRG